MKSIIKTTDGTPVLVDTDRDRIFARQVDKPYYRFYFNKNGAYYAANDSQIVGMSPLELVDEVSGAELIDVDLAETFISEYGK